MLRQSPIFTAVAVALAFLWPVSRGISRLRDTFLLGFCVTTYTVVTVEGFGWLLVSIGIAQCEPWRHRTKLFYLSTFGVILYCREAPWMHWMVEHLVGHLL
jgi:hypothetical protein